MSGEPITLVAIGLIDSRRGRKLGGGELSRTGWRLGSSNISTISSP
jgi:hypothetical protein